MAEYEYEMNKLLASKFTLMVTIIGKFENMRGIIQRGNADASIFPLPVQVGI